MEKSSPVCRMAVPQVSPSIPTQAEAEADLPVLLGVGTMMVPTTEVKPVLLSTAPAQLLEYSTFLVPLAMATTPSSSAGSLKPDRRAARRAAWLAQRAAVPGAARALVAKRAPAARIAVFMVDGARLGLM